MTTAGVRRQSALGVFFEELDRVADGLNRLGRVVGNFAIELLFEGHDEFYRVEAVGAEIVDKMGFVRHLLGRHTQMLDDDLFHPLGMITHCSNLFVQRDLINRQVPSKS
jgi:hypothetical protein